MKPRLYNRLEQRKKANNDNEKRKYNPVGLNISMTIINNSITAWHKVLQSHIAKGTNDEMCIANTIIKTLEEIKKDIHKEVHSKVG